MIVFHRLHKKLKSFQKRLVFQLEFLFNWLLFKILFLGTKKSLTFHKPYIKSPKIFEDKISSNDLNLLPFGGKIVVTFPYVLFEESRLHQK